LRSSQHFRASRAVRMAAWLATWGTIVLVGRQLAYAVAPESALTARLEGVTAPPDPLLVTAIVLGIAAVLSLAAVWFAAMGVAERHRLEPRAVAPPPISVPRLALRTLALFVASSIAFASLESYIHVREGLGFHGIHCLVGPVHEDVLPFLAGLSLLAAALAAVLEHVLAWIRRTVVLLAAAWRTGRAAVPRALALATPASAPVARGNRPRGPPAAARRAVLPL
jgi:hypothetical protein